MNIMSLEQFWDWLQANTSALLIAGGVLLGMVLVVLLHRAVKRGTADNLAVMVATLLATAFSAEGMYEVATEQLRLPAYLAGGLFIVAEAAMLASAVRAHRHFQRCGNLGKHARFVWLIAILAGVVVAFNSATVVEFTLRLLLPPLAAGLWWMGYQDDVSHMVNPGAVTWRWHPRRIAIMLGIIEPGSGDVATVHRERQTRAMTALGYRVHNGASWLRGWRSGRLAKLALLADTQMIEDAADRITQAHRIVALTDPGTGREAQKVATSSRSAVATHDDSQPRQTTARSRAPLTTGRTSVRGISTAERVAKLAARMPTATPAQLASKLSLSERTVQRYLAQLHHKPEPLPVMT